ncbi:NUDIX domain-containing protein, partial [Bacillus cereus]|uniref:NUDIX domain-containing protein n=1 Tax=Bacillus cereus TaxID=1396 RepID=UPI001F16E4E8
MYKHTLCFIKRNEEILMLNRKYDPVKGLWNGVGGKVEKGETPLENAIREIKEEAATAVVEEFKEKTSDWAPPAHQENELTLNSSQVAQTLET